MASMCLWGHAESVRSPPPFRSFLPLQRAGSARPRRSDRRAPTAGEVDQLAATRGQCGPPGPSPRSNAITTDLTTLRHGDLPMGHRSDPRWRTEPTERRGRIADPAPVCVRRVFRVWPPNHVTHDCRELQGSQCRAQPLDGATEHAMIGFKSPLLTRTAISIRYQALVTGLP